MEKEKKITIEEAATLCCFSKSHFMKLFKELTGMSFTAYLVNYRLELSAKQLIETDQKIIDIATNCGFNNHSYFTRCFLKKYGLTPAKYRQTKSLSQCPNYKKQFSGCIIFGTKIDIYSQMCYDFYVINLTNFLI